MHLHLNDLKKHHKSMHVFKVCHKASAQDVNLRKHLEVCRFLSLSFSTHLFILLRKFDPSWCSPLLLRHHFQTQKRDSALFPPSLHRLQLGILLLLLQPFHFNYSLPEDGGGRSAPSLSGASCQISLSFSSWAFLGREKHSKLSRRRCLLHASLARC